jgi:hypothetical protein
VPAELVVSRAGLRYTSPALTALDLCESHGGDAIDEALQARATTLRNLHHALQLTSARLGNAERRRLLLDPKDQPGQLRNASSAGFFETQELPPGRRTSSLCSVARCSSSMSSSEGVKLTVELDGRLYHSGSEVFETDRWRQNL